jgi:glycine betaine transporter
MFFNKAIDTQKLTFILSLAFCLLFLLPAAFFPDVFKLKLEEWTVSSMGIFGNYYLWLGFLAVVLLLILAFSHTGKKTLGKEKPEYGWFSWIAMLYSTGMGGGLMLRAVQEPVYYFSNPPRTSVLSDSEFALQYTFFHWGLTPWAFYGLFGLIISYNLYIRKKSILGSAFLGKRFESTIWVSTVDLLIIICTLLGVVAGVGLGSRQLLSALVYWTEWNQLASGNAIFIVLLVCFLATFSAFLGVNRGIRVLSNLNIGMASILLAFIWLVGSEWSALGNLFKSMGVYLWEFVPMSLNLKSHQVSKDFLIDWTYFYWAFWLAWAPFTGVFIARISQGRTIRQFIVGVILVPSFGTFLWFSVFGGNAFWLLETGSVVLEDFISIYSSLFNFLDNFPLSNWSNAVASILVFTFLITSIDSAIFVLSMFSDKGKTEPNKRFRLFWGITIAIFAMAVIWIGKESLLESVSQLMILFALPFSFLFSGMILYFIYQLYFEKSHEQKS